MNERNYGLDLMRVFLSICVIALHAITYYGSVSFHFDLLAPVFFIAADGMFYIASGYFNLEKEFNNATDIKKYYKNKIIYVLFPFLAFVFVWTVWEYLHENETINILEILSIYCETVINTGADGHMWFMYPLFGMLLGTPFLSKMLHHMDEKELRILWYIAIGFNVVCYYFCMDMGTSFRVLGWFLDGWPIYYIAGYYYRHVIVNESKIKWFILGTLALVFTVFGMRGQLPILKSFVGSVDIQPMFTIFCVALFMFWDKAFNIKNEKLSKIILFLSKNTYMIYLYHMRGIEYAVRKLSIVDNNLGSGLLVTFGAFIFSLIAAFVTNLCMKPVQKLIDKIWIVKE